ncbi:hypothetical protein [Nonomuraea salmonea]|uniref:hypothetical protein n=1 Tax=Nonomuraea salmonea TaxID=46181 RepID=UPI003CD0BEB5
MNLRHIWGDDGDGCSGSDFVDDTPQPGGAQPRLPVLPGRELRQRAERRHVHELHGLCRGRRHVHVHPRPGRAHGRGPGRPSLVVPDAATAAEHARLRVTPAQTPAQTPA